MRAPKQGIVYFNEVKPVKVGWRCHGVLADEGRDFVWSDGDFSIYSGIGSCRLCNAEIDITTVFEIGCDDK